MAETVFVLGAGASKKGGAPLMGEFLDLSSDLFARGETGVDAASFETVFRTIGALQIANSKANLDLTNVESLFNVFEMARLLGVFPMAGSATTAEEAIDALRVVIAATLEATTKFEFSPNNGGLLPPQPYKQFVELLRHLLTVSGPRQSVAVLTFNYDLGLDYALGYGSMDSSYCLTPGTACTVPLLKLHGSLNWAVTDNKAATIVPWQMSDFTNRISGSLLVSGAGTKRLSPRISFAEWSKGSQSLKASPFIVPPTWNKTDHHHAIKPVWERAAAELKEAKNIFVIGYSLPETDGFFKTLYALGTVGASPLRRFWLFDPDKSGQVEARFRQMLGTAAAARFECFTVPFDQAINAIKSEFPPR